MMWAMWCCLRESFWMACARLPPRPQNQASPRLDTHPNPARHHDMDHPQRTHLHHRTHQLTPTDSPGQRPRPTPPAVHCPRCIVHGPPPVCRLRCAVGGRWQDRGMTESFPRQQARTQRFTLGAPRSFQISRDGSRVAFLRSQSGTDPVTCLWVLDVGTGQERLVADPATLDTIDGDIPAQEKASRERTREHAGGIGAFATDTDMTMAAFALGGQVY